jgi:hypothetical protein
MTGGSCLVHANARQNLHITSTAPFLALPFGRHWRCQMGLFRFTGVDVLLKQKRHCLTMLDKTGKTGRTFGIYKRATVSNNDFLRQTRFSDSTYRLLSSNFTHPSLQFLYTFTTFSSYIKQSHNVPAASAAISTIHLQHKAAQTVVHQHRCLSNTVWIQHSP